jgi:Alginate export
MWYVIGVAVCGLFLLTGQVWAADAPAAAPAASLVEAVRSGKPILNLRPRYEFVDQDGRPEEANAYTLRTLAGWKTGAWKGLSGTMELIDVGRLNDEYNDGQNGKTQYPVVADPDNTDVNQLYLDWAGLRATNIRAGRQSIKLDNVRFVGNVEFRQVMQVFNGVTAENTSLRNTRLYAGYLGRVKTVDTRQHDTDTVLLNARYALSPSETLVGYGYFQDQPDAIAAAGFSGPAPTDTSNQIVGLRADGAHSFGDKWKLLYTVEYAKQNDYAGGDARIDAHYQRLGVGGQFGSYSLRVDQELLSSNDNLYAFQTPLGTNHLFQGWADQFLTTPRQGMRDTFLSASAKIEKAQLLAEYHDFKSDFGSIDFGNEFDIGVTYPLMQKLTGKLEYADYKAGDSTSGKVDTRKFWLTLVFNY